MHNEIHSQDEHHAVTSRRHEADREELCTVIESLEHKLKSGAREPAQEQNHLLRSMQSHDGHQQRRASEEEPKDVDASVMQRQLVQLLHFSTQRFQVRRAGA